MITKKILKEQLEITPNYTLGCILSQCFTRYFQPPYCNAERMGVIGANQFRKDKLLEQEVLDYWLEVKEDGYPRICKYTDLINHITYAKEKSFLITGKEKELVVKEYPKRENLIQVTAEEVGSLIHAIAQGQEISEEDYEGERKKIFSDLSAIARSCNARNKDASPTDKGGI